MKRERSDDEETGSAKRSKLIDESNSDEAVRNDETAVEPTKPSEVTTAEVSKSPIESESTKIETAEVAETAKTGESETAKESKEESKSDETNETKESEGSKTSKTSESEESKESKESKSEVDTSEPKPEPKLESQDKPIESAESKPVSSFAAFSSGFSQFSKFKAPTSIAKPLAGSNPWASKPADGEKLKTSEEESKVEKKVADFALQKKETKTGEEEEETVYSCHVRLFFIDLSSDVKQWKERGFGQLKLNKCSENGKDKFRLLMRADGVLRVQLNLPLVKNTQIFKGFTNSLHSEKYFRLASVENERACQFALKCRSEAERDALLKEIEAALQSI